MALQPQKYREKTKRAGVALAMSGPPWASMPATELIYHRLTFTSTAVAGKRMIVQVTNTGGDLGTNNPHHFDLAIPGSGVGLFPEGCQKQFNNAWLGNTYGGYWERNQCDNLPAGQFRNACYWRFDWFKNADNPTVNFREVSCPQAMIDRTACGRWS
jgi:hypothetical protein